MERNRRIYWSGHVLKKCTRLPGEAGSAALAMVFPAVLLALLTCLSVGIGSAFAGQGEVYHCATTDDVHAALKAAGPGDTIMLEGGKVYETGKSFALKADGAEGAMIAFTSEDSSGQGRNAIITTVDQRKEPDLVAMSVAGAHWHISKITITGKKVPLDDGYWDINGFRLGIYLHSPGSHDNLVEDVHIYHTHNAAVAVRDRAHHNTFRRMHIHDIGEWLHKDYNAHEGEGFYIGSSKGFDEKAYNAIAHDIVVEDSVIGPGLLGQYIDLKYASSRVTVRNNVLHCTEKSYNEEIVKLAGYANTIHGNQFVGAAANLTRYVHAFNKKTRVPVRVDYLDQEDIPAPTGRDNTVRDNLFYADRQGIKIIQNDLVEADRPTLVSGNNLKRPLDAYAGN